jgi:uncharacterized protein (TIGR02466 family)
MAEMNLWFPVSIYTEKNILTGEEHQQLVNHVDTIKKDIPSGGKDWFGSIYTSFETYDIRQDAEFDNLLHNIKIHVQDYAKMHNSIHDYQCQQAWFNESVENQFQEFHTHASNVISAVYYLRAPEGAGDIVFKDPKQPDMNPLKNVTELNDLNFASVSFEPIENSLIIFRSYLPHMVKPGKNKVGRISVACNYA